MLFTKGPTEDKALKKNNTHQNYQQNGQELKGEEIGEKYWLEEEVILFSHSLSILKTVM